MAESGARIKLTLDGQQAIQQADRLKSKTKEAATAAGELGKNWERAGGTLAKNLVGIMAIVAGVRQAVTAVSDLRREQGEAYKAGEEAARRIAIEEERLGLRKGFTRTAQTRDPKGDAFTNEQAAKTLEQLREAKVRDPASIERALFAAGSGYFDDDEIIDKKRRRVISQSAIDARFAAMKARGLDPARRARQAESGGQREFAEQGVGEAAINAEAERTRRQSGISAAISGVQPDILNRMEAERNLRLERIFARGIKTTPNRPQTGARGEQ